jgi:hypothetical protein
MLGLGEERSGSRVGVWDGLKRRITTSNKRAGLIGIAAVVRVGRVDIGWGGVS